MLLAASALFALTLARPAAAAPGAAKPAMLSAPATGPAYSFDDYRAYRIKSFVQRRQRLAERLADPKLPAAQKAELEQRKAYYDWLAEMPVAVRDRRYRDRFDRIDTDHDGTIDPAERAAWRAKERAYYRRRAAERAALRAQTVAETKK